MSTTSTAYEVRKKLFPLPFPVIVWMNKEDIKTLLTIHSEVVMPNREALDKIREYTSVWFYDKCIQRPDADIRERWFALKLHENPELAPLEKVRTGCHIYANFFEVNALRRIEELARACDALTPEQKKWFSRFTEDVRSNQSHAREQALLALGYFD